MPPAPQKKTPLMTRAEVREFIEALATHNPAPETELTFTDPFTLLVAVVLSAQATDVSVNKATRTLFQVAPTPKAMIALGIEGVASHIRSIGLRQGKAHAVSVVAGGWLRNVVALSQVLEDKHGGIVPGEREALEALPGVGRKTANVVLNVAFGESTMAVDTHIFRLGNRTGLAPGKTPREVEDGLLKRLPPERLRQSHHWLPECWRCAAAQWCRYRDKTPRPAMEGGVPAGPGTQASEPA